MPWLLVRYKTLISHHYLPPSASLNSRFQIQQRKSYQGTSVYMCVSFLLELSSGWVWWGWLFLLLTSPFYSFKINFLSFSLSLTRLVWTHPGQHWMWMFWRCVWERTGRTCRWRSTVTRRLSMTEHDSRQTNNLSTSALSNAPWAPPQTHVCSHSCQSLAVASVGQWSRVFGGEWRL